MQVCLARLIPQFPTATRVSVLEGMIMEAKGDQDGALRYYEGLLALDEGNVVRCGPLRARADDCS